MENADIQRLDQLKFFLKIKSYSEFSRQIGLKNPQIFTDIRNKNTGISKKLAEKICDTFPNVSFQWLLTGEGPMLKQEGGPNVFSNGDNNKIAGHDINECTKLEALYEARISDLQDRVSHQRAIIDSLTRTLEAMANK